MANLYLLACLVLVFCFAHGYDLRGLLRDRRSCKELFEPCRGLPRCCGEMQCLWEDGYSPFKEGYCVSCVDRSQKCQRDSQCCEPLMCDKGNALHIDGICDIKKEAGGECYRDEQCSSEDCDKSWYKTHGYCS